MLEVGGTLESAQQSSQGFIACGEKYIREKELQLYSLDSKTWWLLFLSFTMPSYLGIFIFCYTTLFFSATSHALLHP